MPAVYETPLIDPANKFATNTNATYGTMHTFWRFTLRDGKISRFETGQAGAG